MHESKPAQRNTLVDPERAAPPARWICGEIRINSVAPWHWIMDASRTQRHHGRIGYGITGHRRVVREQRLVEASTTPEARIDGSAVGTWRQHSGVLPIDSRKIYTVCSRQNDQTQDHEAANPRYRTDHGVTTASAG